MRGAALTIGILFLALAAGCAGLEEAPPSVMAPAGPVMVEPTPVEPNQAPRPETNEEASVALAPPPAIEAIEIEPVAAVPAPAPSPAPPSRSQSAVKAVLPPAKAPVRVSAAAVAIEEPQKNEEPPAPPAAVKKVDPPLDVAALKARLRSTKAIGVFTKLALQNQMDDLLKQFRAHHESGQKTSVASLRQPYDSLVFKVVAVVQDGDPSLARTISESREAIWDILADPEKFNSVTLTHGEAS